VPESVPWLIANHKLEKAEGIVRRVFQTYHARLPAALTVRRQVQIQMHCTDIARDRLYKMLSNRREIALQGAL